MFLAHISIKNNDDNYYFNSNLSGNSRFIYVTNVNHGKMSIVKYEKARDLLNSIFKQKMEYQESVNGYDIYVDNNKYKRFFKGNNEDSSLFFYNNGVDVTGYKGEKSIKSILKAFSFILAGGIATLYTTAHGLHTMQNFDKLTEQGYVYTEEPKNNYYSEVDLNQIKKYIYDSEYLTQKEKDILYNEDLLNLALKYSDESRKIYELNNRFEKIYIRSYSGEGMEEFSGFYTCENYVNILDLFNRHQKVYYEILQHEYIHLLQNLTYIYIMEGGCGILNQEFYNTETLDYENNAKRLKVLMEIIGPDPILQCMFNSTSTMLEDTIYKYLGEEKSVEFLTIMAASDWRKDEEVHKKIDSFLAEIYYNKYHKSINDDELIQKIYNGEVERYYFNDKAEQFYTAVGLDAVETTTEKVDDPIAFLYDTLDENKYKLEYLDVEYTKDQYEKLKNKKNFQEFINLAYKVDYEVTIYNENEKSYKTYKADKYGFERQKDGKAKLVFNNYLTKADIEKYQDLLYLNDEKDGKKLRAIQGKFVLDDKNFIEYKGKSIEINKSTSAPSIYEKFYKDVQNLTLEHSNITFQYQLSEHDKVIKTNYSNVVRELKVIGAIIGYDKVINLSDTNAVRKELGSYLSEEEINELLQNIDKYNDLNAAILLYDNNAELLESLEKSEIEVNTKIETIIEKMKENALKNGFSIDLEQMVNYSQFIGDDFEYIYGEDVNNFFDNISNFIKLKVGEEYFNNHSQMEILHKAISDVPAKKQHEIMSAISKYFTDVFVGKQGNKEEIIDVFKLSIDEILSEYAKYIKAEPNYINNMNIGLVIGDICKIIGNEAFIKYMSEESNQESSKNDIIEELCKNISNEEKNEFIELLEKEATHEVYFGMENPEYTKKIKEVLEKIEKKRLDLDAVLQDYYNEIEDFEEKYGERINKNIICLEHFLGKENVEKIYKDSGIEGLKYELSKYFYEYDKIIEDITSNHSILFLSDQYKKEKNEINETIDLAKLIVDYSYCTENYSSEWLFSKYNINHDMTRALAKIITILGSDELEAYFENNNIEGLKNYFDSIFGQDKMRKFCQDFKNNKSLDEFIITLCKESEKNILLDIFEKNNQGDRTISIQGYSKDIIVVSAEYNGFYYVASIDRKSMLQMDYGQLFNYILKEAKSKTKLENLEEKNEEVLEENIEKKEILSSEDLVKLLRKLLIKGKGGSAVCDKMNKDLNSRVNDNRENDIMK